LAGGPEAGPFIAAIAGDGEEAVPIGADGGESGGGPADVALGVGVNVIEAGDEGAGEAGAEVVEIAGGGVGGAAEVGGGAGFEPGRTDGEGAAGVGPDDGAVAGEGEFGVDGRAPFTGMVSR
jgi:hypothetical protein